MAYVDYKSAQRMVTATFTTTPSQSPTSFLTSTPTETLTPTLTPTSTDTDSPTPEPLLAPVPFSPKANADLQYTFLLNYCPGIPFSWGEVPGTDVIDTLQIQTGANEEIASVPELRDTTTFVI